MAEWTLTSALDGPITPLSPWVRGAGNSALAAVWLGGVCALLGDADSVKCLGLIAAFFAPVFAIVWNLGARYWCSHWRLFVAGGLPTDRGGGSTKGVINATPTHTSARALLLVIHQTRASCLMPHARPS